MSRNMDVINEFTILSQVQERVRNAANLLEFLGTMSPSVLLSALYRWQAWGWRVESRRLSKWFRDNVHSCKTLMKRSQQFNKWPIVAVPRASSFYHLWKAFTFIFRDLAGWMLLAVLVTTPGTCGSQPLDLRQCGPYLLIQIWKYHFCNKFQTDFQGR